MKDDFQDRYGFTPDSDYETIRCNKTNKEIEGQLDNLERNFYENF